MKLRTSFFKPVTLKKDILRYAPIWALYLIGMMMVLLDEGGYGYYDYTARKIDDLIKSFGIVNLCYAGVCANLLFGDLYNTKLCYSLHAMPLRRESWLTTHLIAGLLFSLVPNLVATLYLMALLENYWFIALYWLLAVTLQYLFFFGLATVSALLTGNRFAMLAVYAGFNFVSMLLYATVETIYLPMLMGVVADVAPFQRFSPVVNLFNFDYFTFSSKQVATAGQLGSNTRTFYVFEGLADGWGYLAILGAVGIAAVAVCVWLYRIRHLESAGDFVAFPRLKGVSCVIITLCVALCCALLGEALDGGYLFWLPVGLTVGFFGSLMLLERRVKVFRKKTFLGFAILAVAVALSVAATELDWFGVENWTPKASQVQSVTVANYKNSNYAYDYADGSRLSTTVTDPAEIAELIAAHEDILSRKVELNNDTAKHRVVLTYKMKSGRTVIRSYYAPASGENYRIVRKYLYNTENLLGFRNWEEAAKRTQHIYMDNMQIPSSLYGPFLQALQTDCQDGHVLAEAKAEHFIEYGFEDETGRYVWRNLFALDSAENLLALMKKPEIMMCYDDWDSFPLMVRNLVCNDQEVSLEHQQALLTALRQDIEAGTLWAYNYDKGGMVIFYSVAQPGGDWIYREFFVSPENINTWAIVSETYA